ncbi:hypothetical protein TNCV_4364461 [Trichonephila clavipes]|nr:hypothetical protein TNCV_4364461 [Trichonephila clavipes]
MTTSADSWSDRTMQSNDSGTATAGVGAVSPSRLCFDDAFIVENSDLFRETIIARNVCAAWARKLTTAKPNDPELQNIHMEVAKSGEIVSTHLAKLDVPLFKIPAPEKELDRIILREKNKTIASPKKREEKRPAAVPPPPLPLPARVEKARREPSTPTASLPPKQLVRKARSPRSTPPPSPTPSSAPDIDGALLEEPDEEEMETSNDLPQSQEEVPVVAKKPRIPPFFVSPKVIGGSWWR